MFLVVCKLFEIVLIGLLSIGAPRLCYPRCLLDRYPMPAFGKQGRKDRHMKFIGLFLDAKERDILLAQRQIDRNQLI